MSETIYLRGVANKSINHERCGLNQLFMCINQVL